MLSAPAGRRTFPTLSLRICPCVLGPLPRRLVRCVYPFLPPSHRPSPRSDQVGAPQSPCSDFSTAPFSRLQSFPHVQARRYAHHPGRSYRYGHVRRAAVVFTSEPLMVRYLPTPRICLPSESGHGRQRTFTSSDAQPCRLLPERSASGVAASGSAVDAVGSRPQATVRLGVP